MANTVRGTAESSRSAETPKKSTPSSVKKSPAAKTSGTSAKNGPKVPEASAKKFPKSPRAAAQTSSAGTGSRQAVVRAAMGPLAARAARTVERREHIAVDLPKVGQVMLPHPQDLAYFAGVGALVALELLEWPAAVALAVGHALSAQHRSRVLEEFGDALEDA